MDAILSSGKNAGFSLLNSARIRIEAFSGSVNGEVEVMLSATSLIPHAGLSVKCSATFSESASKSDAGTKPDINGGFMPSDVTFPPVSTISWRKVAGTVVFACSWRGSAWARSKLE